MTILEVEHLKKTYTTRLGSNRVEALRDVTFNVEQGEFVAIMGESGSGKTTLLNLLAALDKPTGGQIRLNGKNLGDLKEKEIAAFRRENLGFVFQDFKLIQDFTVEENVSLPLVLTGEKKKEISRRTEGLMKLVGLQDKRRNPVTELSGGQRQRVAIARALINQPRILLADEPTGNLDCNTAYEIMQIFLELKQEGQSTILVTHDPTIASYADRVLFLQDGRIYGEYEQDGRDAHGDVDEILAKFRESQRMAESQKGKTYV